MSGSLRKAEASRALLPSESCKWSDSAVAATLAKLKPDDHPSAQSLHSYLCCFLGAARDPELPQPVLYLIAPVLRHCSVADMDWMSTGYVLAFACRWLLWVPSCRPILLRHWPDDASLDEVNSYTLYGLGTGFLRPSKLQELDKAGIRGDHLRAAAQGLPMQIGRQKVKDIDELVAVMASNAKGYRRRSALPKWGLGLGLASAALGVGGMKAFADHPPKELAVPLYGLMVLGVLGICSVVLGVGSCSLCKGVLGHSPFAGSGGIPLLNRRDCCPHCGAELEDQTLMSLLGR